MSLESGPDKNRRGNYLETSSNQEEDMDIDSDQNVFSDEEERKLDKKSRWIKRLNCFVFPDQIIAGKVSITSYGSWDDINDFDSTQIAWSLKKFSRPPKAAICSQLKMENCSKVKYEMIQQKANLDQFHAACKPGSLFPDGVIGDVSKAPKTDCVQVARLETPQTTVVPPYLQRVRGNQKHYYNAYYEANHYNLQIQQAQVIANPDPSGHDFIYLSE
uniref:DDE_Tnp_1_7 domain-containing protein n=1 Tax=Rhabditophanes sp. KR3021 TaxID=114890 RepID=A0AC35TYF7_9BILA